MLAKKSYGITALYTPEPPLKLILSSPTSSLKPCDTTRLIQELTAHVPTADPEDRLCDLPSADEIQQKLTSMGNSGPGHDHIEYRHLRLLNEKCELLTLIFHRCLTQQHP